MLRRARRRRRHGSAPPARRRGAGLDLGRGQPRLLLDLDDLGLGLDRTLGTQLLAVLERLSFLAPDALGLAPQLLDALGPVGAAERPLLFEVASASFVPDFCACNFFGELRPGFDRLRLRVLSGEVGALPQGNVVGHEGEAIILVAGALRERLRRHEMAEFPWCIRREIGERQLLAGLPRLVRQRHRPQQFLHVVALRLGGAHLGAVIGDLVEGLAHRRRDLGERPLAQPASSSAFPKISVSPRSRCAFLCAVSRGPLRSRRAASSSLRMRPLGAMSTSRRRFLQRWFLQRWSGNYFRNHVGAFGLQEFTGFFVELEGIAPYPEPAPPLP